MIITRPTFVVSSNKRDSAYLNQINKEDHMKNIYRNNKDLLIIRLIKVMKIITHTKIIVNDRSSTSQTCITCGCDGWLWPQICTKEKPKRLHMQTNCHTLTWSLHDKC